jgi:hypothetical protein
MQFIIDYRLELQLVITSCSTLEAHSQNARDVSIDMIIDYYISAIHTIISY